MAYRPSKDDKEERVESALKNIGKSQPIVEWANEDVDVLDLYDKGKEILRREIKNLLMDSMKGALKSRQSETLVSYINLLGKMVKEEKDKLKSLSEEELKALTDETK